MKIHASVRDILWNYAGTIFYLSSGFLVLPFLLHFLDSSSVGLWYIFLAVGGVLNLFDLGFDPTFARNVAFVWRGAVRLTRTGAEFVSASDAFVKPNFHLMNSLIKACRLFYGAISSIVLVLAASVGSLYIIHVSSSLSGAQHFIAWGIYCVGLFLNLYFGYYSALLRGIGAVAAYNRALILSKIVQMVSSIVLLFLGFGIVAMSVGFLLNGLILRMLCRAAFDANPEIKHNLHKSENSSSWNSGRTVFKIISYNAFRDGVVSFSNYFASQASSIVCSFFLSLSATGIYSISLQFVNAISSLATSQITAYQPTLQSAFVEKNVDEERSIIGRGVVSYYLIFALGITGVAIFVRPFLAVFKPGTSFDILFFLGLALYYFLWQQQSIFASYISNTNQIPYMLPFLYSSILGIVLSVVLMRFFNLGLWGLVLGQGIVQAAYNNWKWILVVCQRLGTTWLRLTASGFRYWYETARKFLIRS